MRVNEVSPAVIADENVLVDLIIDSIRDIKGKNIVKMDLRQLDDAPASFFIICEGESTTQVRAISENIGSRVKKELQMAPSHVEGRTEARWVCVDYFDTIVHVFYPEVRTFYDLEDFWSDAIIESYEDD